MRYFVKPYKQGSASAKLLAEKLGGKVLKLIGSRYRPRSTDIVIQWGGEENDKLIQFQNFHAQDVPTVHFTTSKNEAAQMLQEGTTNRILARTLLRSHSGRGIHIVEDPAALPEAPLYVSYHPKTHEYRVHVWNNTVILIQEKRRVSKSRRGADYNSYVRNHANGWIFCLQNVECPQSVQSAALSAVLALHRNSGAVDVGYNQKTGDVRVYEVNSAPGLTNSTAEIYAEAIRNQ